MLGKRIISTLLAVLMLVGSFALVIQAEDSEVITYTKKTNNQVETMDYLNGLTNEGEAVDTPEKKLATMDCRYTANGYELYVDAYSGEVALRNVTTNDILFTNPYSMAREDTYLTNASTGRQQAVSTANKYKLLSQLIVHWVDIKTESPTTYSSFEYAAMRKGQITVNNIRGGIRLEYSIGKEATKLLLPRVILTESFETKVLEPFMVTITEEVAPAEAQEKLLERIDRFGWDEEQDADKIEAYYQQQLELSIDFYEQQLKSAYQKMPYRELADSAFTGEVDLDPEKDGDVELYVMRGEIYDFAETQMNKISLWIDEYTEYTFEDMETDHEAIGYVAKEEIFPVFKMALEYTLDEKGLTVKLPANGLRFDESLARLDYIEVLPYMGAGNTENSGYIFFPDGSGTIFTFEDLIERNVSTTATGKIYGVDYAYHTISSTIKNQEAVRYPVYGIAETDAETNVSRGFLAIVEEGDAMMELSAELPINSYNYNSVKMKLYPRPQDQYRMDSAVAGGSSDMWTVVSARKYTGDVTVRYIMLTDENVAEQTGYAGSYAPSYVGMAKAYREYLLTTGKLGYLNAEDVKEDIPVFIETLGTMETTEKILSVPVDVMTPLTTFKDIQTMRDQLANKGVSNINFVLNGYTKGGLEAPAVPYHLNWENCLEKDLDFEGLLADAKAKGYGIYPDFDFVFASGNKMFDGLSLSKHAAKTIDDRYTSKREYNSTFQTRVGYFQLALSPAYFSRFYEKLSSKYLKYEPIGISVSTMGNYLNSDFDEDEPYNREDSKNFTKEALQYLDSKYSKVMTSGGNAYTWSYVDYIKDIALDSSRYSVASASVPFLGMVLHGSVQYAGSPINMEGNIDYALLKAIENGASLNFILVYQNYDKLKTSEILSQYYSVRYDIWFNDVVSLYNELNAAMKDIQTSSIVDHQFIDGLRVPEDEEILADAAQAVKDAIAEEEALRADQAETERLSLKNARAAILNAIAQFNAADLDKINALFDDYTAKVEALNTALAEEKLTAASGANKVIAAIKNVEKSAATLISYCNNLITHYENAKKSLDFLEGIPGSYAEKEMENLSTSLAACAAEYEIAKEMAAKVLTSVTENFTHFQEVFEVKLNTQKSNFNKSVTSFNTYYKNDKPSKDLESKLNNTKDGVYTRADAFLKYVGQVINNYENMLIKYDVLSKNSVEGDVELQYLETLMEAFAPTYESVKALPDEIVAEVNGLYEKAVERFEEKNYKYSVSAYVNPLLPVEEEDEEDEDTNDVVVNVGPVADTRYQSADNKIVYEKYSNGKAFILNYNNFTVKTVVNDRVYIVGAYDYAIIQ